MFKYVQRDKEDYRLTPADVEVYAKQAKSSYHASLRACKLGVAAKGIEEFKQAWKYR